MKATVLLLAVVLLFTACAQPQTGQAPSFQSPNKQPNNQPSGGQPQQIPDAADVGSLNHGYLQPRPYSKIIIEIDFVSRQPADSTKSALVGFFHAFEKPVIFSGSNIIPPVKNVYTAEDLRRTEKANRAHYTSGDTAVVYITLLNGQYENTAALGVAYSASSFALFPERMSDATSALVLYNQIEEAVALHEVGHMLGLVNINYKSGRDHEDAEHHAHSKNSNSVMYWAVEDISLKTLLNFGPPREFDSDDMLDLQKIKEGIY